MHLSEDQLKNLASLSRLKESDIEAIHGDLDQILDYVEQVQGVDTSGVEPMTGATDLKNIFRSDEVTSPATSERRAELIGNDTGEIRVPGVFEDPI
jgi:aspartyl-tRNA(Asn)/glutamyl-tRNA(Gln) amidotransferase subunit C